MGDHEGPGVEVSVGDGVNLVDLGIVLYVEVVVARVGRKSEYNLVKSICSYSIKASDWTGERTDLLAMSGLDF